MQVLTVVFGMAMSAIMPIVRIDTKGVEIPRGKTYISADIEFVDQENSFSAHKTQIRPRGNISLNAPKKSYKIKFETKMPMLGSEAAAGKSWNLVANHFDASLMRNIAAYRIGSVLDNMPYTPKCKSVEVYLNNDYQGVYLLVEPTGVSKGRIAITENPNSIEDNGYLVEMSRYAETDSFTVDFATYEIKSDLSSDINIYRKQIEYIRDYTSRAMKALKSGNREEAEKYIDINSLVDNCIANDLAKNIDVGWASYFFYKDAGGKLVFSPMWDYDLAFGNNNEAKGYTSPKGVGLFNVSDCNANSNPWIGAALQQEWFRKLIKTRWHEVNKEIKAIPQYIKDQAENYADAYNRNFEKWPANMGKAIFNEPEDIWSLKSHKQHAGFLAQWIEDRIVWYDKYYDSKEFQKGIWIDENGKTIPSDNVAAFSTVQMWGMDAIMDDTNTGFTVQASENPRGSLNINGMMLESGKPYVLSFDYISNGDATVSYRLQANHGRHEQYMSSSVQATGKRNSVKESVVIPVNDFNTTLSFRVSGSGTVTISNLNLTQVK